MTIELFLAKEDFTWTTEIVEVPNAIGSNHERGSPWWEHEVVGWAHKDFALKGFVFQMIAVWDPSPEIDEEELANIPQDVE